MFGSALWFVCSYRDELLFLLGRGAIKFKPTVFVIIANYDKYAPDRNGDIKTDTAPCGKVAVRTRVSVMDRDITLSSPCVLCVSSNVGRTEAEVDTFSSVKISCSISFSSFSVTLSFSPPLCLSPHYCWHIWNVIQTIKKNAPLHQLFQTVM